MTKEQKKVFKQIILDKCNFKESLGLTHLSDSDVSDILDECKEKKIPVTKEDMCLAGFEEFYK